MKLEQYMTYIWVCDVCNCTNVSDLTNGEEVECDNCGSYASYSSEITKEMYDEAKELYDKVYGK